MTSTPDDVSPGRPGEPGGGRPAGGWAALRRSHPRLARLVAFAPLALVVAVLVLLLGLPWWSLALALAGLGYVLVFHA
jgi:hypothetical protein